MTEPASPSAAEPTAPSATVDMALAAPILGKWRPEPVPIPPSLIPLVDQECREVFGADDPVGATLALIDARGEGVLDAYYAGPAAGWASCTNMVLNPFGGVLGERGHIVSGEGTEVPGPLKIAFIDFTWSFGKRPITASYLVGWAGAGVARVEIRSPGLRPVVASIANGWWAAWLPGPMPAQWRIVGLDAIGRDVDTIDGVAQVDP